MSPGRVVIDGRFGVITAGDLQPIHVEIGIESLRAAANSAADVADSPGVRAWGNLYTEIQERLVWALQDSQDAPVTVVLS